MFSTKLSALVLLASAFAWISQAGAHLPYADIAAQMVLMGTGLGLTIVRSIVEHHGGHLALASVEDEGTTVTVRLPLATMEQDGSTQD